MGQLGFYKITSSHFLRLRCLMQVCLKGTLFTPLSANNTSTQSLNVQLRKTLDLHVNLVHGWTMPGVPSRFSDIDIVVIRYEIQHAYTPNYLVIMHDM